MHRKVLFVFSLMVVVFLFVQKSSFTFSLNHHPGFKKSKQVVIVPLGKNISKEFIDQNVARLKEFLPQIKILNSQPMPSMAYYSPRKRYRADSLIHWLSQQAQKDEVYLGITHQDISTTKKPYTDWGVMGLGFQPGNACVASDFRLKNKTMFWKVLVHELGHTAGLPHCSNKACLMRDAEGRDHTEAEKEFCSFCKKKLKLAGWMN